MHGIAQIVDELIYNLCDNAIKYNRKGGSVTVSTAEENGQPVLRVADTGIGIPAAEQDRVFERFTAWIRAIRAPSAARASACPS